jgi:hypothetical protein
LKDDKRDAQGSITRSHHYWLLLLAGAGVHHFDVFLLGCVVTSDINEWRKTVDERLKIHTDTLEQTQHTLYGFWSGNVRTPGILEQNQNLLLELSRQRDDTKITLDEQNAEIHKFLAEQTEEREAIKKLIWAIARPVIVGIGIICIITFLEFLGRLNLWQYISLGAHTP